MSSYIRNLQRKAMRKSPDYEAKPQPTIVCEHGYYTLRPTKGWTYISNARIAAREKIAEIMRRKD